MSKERPDIRPDDHEERMTAAVKRAQWELGDGNWADIIVGAYLWPDADRTSLAIDMEDAGE